MSCGCDTIFLGCFKHCKDIKTGSVKATQTGTHVLITRYRQGRYCREIYAVKGGHFVIPNEYNETAYVTFEIQNPDGTQFEHEGVSCFSFQNVLGFDIVCDNSIPLCEDPCVEPCND